MYFKMWKSVVRLTPTLSFSIFSKGENAYDHDFINSPSIGTPVTGWDRVKRMYTKNDYDEISTELHSVVQSTMCGTFFGACMGGFVKSREAYLYFIESNQATIFKTMGEAKKKLQDYVTMGFAKGAYQWGWKLGIFTGMFSLIATTISVYRDNTSIADYTTAGALTGGLYRAHLGLAATFVGSLLGAVLSTVAGLTIVAMLKLTGFSINDIRKALLTFKEGREEQYKQALDKSSEIKTDELTVHHTVLMAEKGEKKISELD